MGNQVNKGFNTTQGRIYLIAEKTLERLEVQFVPTQVEVKPKPNIATFEVVGRNTPHYQFISGKTVVNFTLDFYADEEQRTSVIKKCRWLHSMMMSDGYGRPAQRLKLIWGDLFKSDLWVLTDAPYRVNLFDKEHGLLPRLGYVELTLELDPNKNIQWKDYR